MFSFNETIKYPEDLVREGHTFNGWSSKPERMGTENITVRAQWNVTKPSEYVEIVFSKKGMKEEEIKEIIERYINEDFTIARFENDEDETRIIVKFTDKEKATSFIDTVSAASDITTTIKEIKFIFDINSFAPSPSIFVLFYFLF